MTLSQNRTRRPIIKLDLCFQWIRLPQCCANDIFTPSEVSSFARVDSSGRNKIGNSYPLAVCSPRSIFLIKLTQGIVSGSRFWISWVWPLHWCFKCPTRSNVRKLHVPFTCLERRKAWFSSRVVSLWNSLPSSCVCAPTLALFKKELDHFLLCNPAQWRSYRFFFFFCGPIRAKFWINK